MSHVITTYTSGFDFKGGSWTTHKVVRLCELLESKFEGQVFNPDPISEGGIVFGNYPGVTWVDGVGKRGPYKTMRIRCDSGRGKWPWIQDRENVKQQWAQEPDVVICSDMKGSSTFLKSFDGAPQWTMDELKTFAACMEEVGLDVKKTSFPEASSLYAS